MTFSNSMRDPLTPLKCGALARWFIPGHPMIVCERHQDAPDDENWRLSDTAGPCQADRVTALFETIIAGKCCSQTFIAVTETAPKFGNLVRCKNCGETIELAHDNAVTTPI
jgi:hypothetical protein